MDLLGTISPLWKFLIGGDSSSSSKERRDDMAIVMVEHDTRTEREGANVEVEVAMKESAEETKLADETTSEEADAESHTDDKDTCDDAEMAANAIEEAEPEDEAVEPEPESESGVEVEVEVSSELEIEGELELGDEDRESDDVEVEDEESDGGTADSADTSTVDRICDIGPAYAEYLSGTGTETITDLAAADANEVGGEINVSPRCVQHQVNRAGNV